VKEFLLYTGARIGVFVATYALVAGTYLLVTGGDRLPILWPLLVAAVISGVVSIYLLRGMRERFAAAVHDRAGRASARFEAARSKEDED
jgi:uncharacterized membrane protein